MQDWPLRITRLIDHAEREHGSREIVSRWADGTTTRTDYAGVARDSRRLAKALERIGIRKGDRVATLAMNHSRHIVSWYGTIGMGGIIHTVNPRLFAEQLVYIFNHAEDRVLFYDNAFRPLVDALRPKLATVEHFICFDDAGGEFEALIAAQDDDYRWVEGDEREPAMLCYTSGTTGNPKGVLYEHRSTVLHAMAALAVDVFDLSRRAVVMPIVPMFHAAAWGLPFAAPMAGCKMVCTADYQPQAVCDILTAEEVTHTAAVPTVWLGLMQHVEATGAGLGKLRLVSIGGSAAPRAMIEFFQSRGVEVGHAWGMTEMSPIGTTGARPHYWEALSFDEKVDIIAKQGSAPFGVEMRIVDDAGQILPRDGGSAGRLHVRGPWVIRQYFREEQPAVEGVAEAAAIGVYHPKWDERPLLLVVRGEGSDVTAEDIQAHLKGEVAKWWLPDEILFVESLPHTATGKLLKTELRERYKDYRLKTAA